MSKAVCKALGCTELIPGRKLMCNPHWRMLPPNLQAIILGEGYDRRWREAVLTAIEHVKEVEARAVLQEFINRRSA